MRRLSSLVVAILSSCGVQEAPSSEVGHLRQGLDAVNGFGSNPGNLLMYRFVPPGLPRGRPLVVLLHGCGDTAENFARGSGFEAQATQLQFALVVPQQQAANNLQTCFNWFDPLNQARGSGELASIGQMVDRMVTDVGSDAQQVFVAGFSAGGAEAVNLLATSPDRYRAGAVAAGVAFKCAESAGAAFSCLSGVNQSAMTWAMRVRAAAPVGTTSWPRVSLWQGLADTLVAPSNRTELLEQWTTVHGIDQMADGTMPITSGGTRSFFRAGAAGPALVELNEFAGLDHVWRTAWARDMVTFFGITAPPATDGGAAGGSAGGGGSTAGGAAGGAAGGSGGSAGGGSGGGATAGGAAGGSGLAGGAAAGGMGGAGLAGGAAGGTAMPQPMGCASCSVAGHGAAWALLALALARRRRAQ